jgi:hypothetical protein
MADPGNLQVPPLGGIQSGVVTGGVSPALVLGIVNGIAILGVSAVVYRQVMDLQSQVAAYKADIVHLNNQLGNLAREVQGLNNKVATYDKILKKIPKMRGEFFEITEGDRREWQEGLRRSNENFAKLKGEKDMPLLDVANIPQQPVKRVQINGDRPRQDQRRDARGPPPRRRQRDDYDDSDNQGELSESDVEDYIRDLGGNSRRSK